MTNKDNKYFGRFVCGNISQWNFYENGSDLIWIAGDNIEKKYNYLVKEITSCKDINVVVLKKIIKNIHDHFGIVYISKNWIFAAVDFARTYPIFWKKVQENFIFSPQALKLINKKKDIVDDDQLLAFRMSGYTVNEGTLWKNVKNLNPGNFIFVKKNDNYSIEQYFNYTPWKHSTKSYNNLKKQLKYEIDKLLKNTIIKANGRTLVIPLSAGLDSRLIASGLKHYNYKNVKCFSYGLKNNYESEASRIISKKLGYKWKFIEINQKKAKNFYASKNHKNYMKNSLDGCATSTIQGIFAINKLLEDGYINEDDVIINGNSGDFISGGHAPTKAITRGKNITTVFEEIFEQHYLKHYSLWQKFLDKKNKNIIKKQLYNQIKNNINDTDEYFMAHGIAEFLEYQNRQTKYVINSQRIYEYYNLKWQLPLWDKSFIKFWSDVPLKYKKNQMLYKDALNELNMGGVWESKYNFNSYVKPNWIRFLRIIIKLYFLFIGIKKWHSFERQYMQYWMDNICGQSILPYSKIINNKNVSRHYVSWLTIFSEDIMFNSNWQNLDIDHNYEI